MTDNLNKYGLDFRCTMMLEEYREMLPVLRKLSSVVTDLLHKCLDEANILVTAVESRVKGESSLAGKLELKGYKYKSITDVTDLVGARVITFYSDEVDKIAAMAEKLFDVDWTESVDKRKLLGKESFGYMSLHYICTVPKSVFFDSQMPQLNAIRFELQMRTTLQHVWANMNHDTGYKSGVEIPSEYGRRLVRLAGLLELADDESSRLRREINDYRRKVEKLVKDGSFDEVDLNGDTFRSYLQMDPFGKLNQKIADINQSEVQQVSGLYFLEGLLGMGFKTLGDLERLRQDYEEAAYQMALHQMSGTDLDIISSTLGLQNLCFTYIFDRGDGIFGLECFLDSINGKSSYNRQTAQRTFDVICNLPFFKQKQKYH